MARSRALSSRGLSRLPPRRKISWEDGPGGTGLQTQIASSVSLLVSTGTGILVDGLTLVRLRGQLTMSMAISSASGQSLTGAFGLAVIREEAFSDVGVTAVPTPITEQDWNGWIYWAPIQLISSGTAPAVDSEPTTVMKQIVDTKAMRKLDLGDVIYGAIEVVEGGVITVDWAFDSRILLKLP